MTELIISGIVSMTFGVLGFVIQNLLKEIRKLRQDKEEDEKVKRKALEQGVLSLLRGQLIDYHTKYMKSGAISLHGYENWVHMYQAYKGLGGNGMIAHMNEDIEELQMKHGKEAT